MMILIKMQSVLNDSSDKRQHYMCSRKCKECEQWRLNSDCAIRPGDRRTSLSRSCFCPGVRMMFARSAQASLLTQLVPMGETFPLQGLAISL